MPMIVYAVNVHVGGGKVLLDELISKGPFGQVTTLFCDKRYTPPSTQTPLKVISVVGSLKERWKAEFVLKEAALQSPQETVLCFGNMPPMCNFPNKTVVYVQNAFLVPGTPIPKEEPVVYLRYLYERTWFWLFKDRVDEFWIQSNSMLKRMSRINLKTKVLIRPFLPDFPKVTRAAQPKYDFITVVSSKPQKRLDDFLNALIVLAQKKIQAKALVISNALKPHHEALRNRLKDTSVTLDVSLDASRDKVFEAYADSKCLVNNSEIESFCLPLFEAKHVGLNIISCNEDYALEATPSAEFYSTGDVTALAALLEKELT